MSLTAAWCRLVDTTDDGRAVAATRVLTGVAALVLLRSSSRRFDRTFDPDRLHVPWPPLGDHLTHVPAAVVLALWGIGALVLIVGVGARLGAAAVATGMVCFYGADQQNYGTAGYFLLLVALLLTLADSGAARTPWGPTRRAAPWWPSFLLASQLSIMYGFAAIQKFRSSSLAGDTIRWQLHGPLAEQITWEPLPQVLNLAGGLTELFCALGLWFAATRRVAALAGVGLHLGILAFIRDSADLLAFGAASVAVYPVFWAAGPPIGAAWRSWRASRHPPTAAGHPT